MPALTPPSIRPSPNSLISSKARAARSSPCSALRAASSALPPVASRAARSLFPWASASASAPACRSSPRSGPRSSEQRIRSRREGGIMADKYLVPQRLDDPELIGFWTVDEFAGLLIPFAWGILAQHIFIGIALAFEAWFVLRKAKSGNAGSALVTAAYL